MTTNEVLKLALEALEIEDMACRYEKEPTPEHITKAITALREALAEQPAQQEPVAWRTFDGEGGYEYRSYEMNEQYAQEWEQRNPKHKGWVEPLYTTPPPCPTCEALARTVMMDQTGRDTSPPASKPLTDEQIMEMYNEPRSDAEMVEFARAIEAKLREKNNG